MICTPANIGTLMALSGQPRRPGGRGQECFLYKVLHSNFEWIEGWLRASLVPVCISLQLFRPGGS